MDDTPQPRLSATAFANTMQRLHADVQFRERFLRAGTGGLLRETGDLGQADASHLAAIAWPHGRKDFRPFDEKLVLCSSSGY